MYAHMKSEADAIARRLRELNSFEVPRAISSALNKTANKTRTQIAKAVKQETGVPAAAIKDRFYVRPSSPKKLNSRITVYPRDIPAISLGVAQTRLRVTRGRIKGGGSIRVGNRTFKNTFINEVRRNYTWHVLQRTQGTRYPIDVVKVRVSVAVEKHAKKIAHQIYDQDFQKTLVSELNYRISKYAKS